MKRVFLFSCLLLCSRLAPAEQPISAAEQFLFLEHHLSNTAEAKALRYTLRHEGTLETAFCGQVNVTLGAQDAAGGRASHVEFLAGERAVNLPDIEAATANPVILSFLERDVREMQRLTKGQPGYFRKRVRMALAGSAKVEKLQANYSGKNIPIWQVSITPYVDDPLKPRFARYANKTYSFTLSDQIPGWVLELRTVVHGSEAAPLIEEVLRFEGADQ
ncbi:MAG: hypothetical protein ACKVQA_04345 [Burkholderiales bacterium]